MRNTMRWILPLLLIFFGSGACFAQSTNSGDIRGSVTDPSGALVPGVTVSVLNVDTGVAKDYVTNQDGLYDTSSIVAGRYKLTFKKEGFERFVRGPVTVDVGLTTVNAALKVGATTTEVTVNTDVPLLQTETGDQTSTLESKSMGELPNVGGSNGNDWENFMILLPGTTGTPNSNAGSSNPGQEVSTNGNLPFTNVLADGASTTLPSSQNANPAVFEDVEELQVSLSSFSAQYGVGGMVINQITKGGTSKFHGAGYEYVQNDAFNAYPYEFGQSASSVGKKPPLRYDNFGGTVSGPVKVAGLGKKAFFFFGYDQIIDNGVNNGFQTVPTAAVLSGDFTESPYTLYDPTTQTIGHDVKGNPYPIRQSFASEYGNGNRIPASMMDKVAANYGKLFPTGTTSYGHYVPSTPNGEGVEPNNWNYSYPNPRPWRRYFGRLDYDITPNNRLTMSDTQGDEIESNSAAIFACPVSCQLGDVDNNNAQISDVWNISSHTINEARMGYTDQLNFFSDAGSNKGIVAQLGWQFSEGMDVLPYVQYNRDYPYSWVSPGTNAQYKEFVFDPSDVVTMIRGKHILHFGGEFAFYRDDTTNWGNENSGTLTFNGAYTENWTNDPVAGASPNGGSTGLEYADLLLGYMSSWNAGYTPEYGWRLKKPQMFVQDDWKLHPNLTINLGVRYEISHGMSEVKGNIASFDPTVKNDDGTLGAMWFASTHANGRTALQANVFSTVLPRVGFAWLPKPNTTVRGGFGVYSYNFSQDAYGNGLGAAVASNGNQSDQSNGIYPVTKWDGPGILDPLGSLSNPLPGATPLPFVGASTDPGKFNGTGAAYYNPYHTPIPKAFQWNADVQRQLGVDYVADVAYVGSHGLNLSFPTDINTVPETKLGPNDTQYRPFQNFQNIGANTYSAISNYTSLQASITKRMTHGLSLSFNYVWSHMLDDQDSSGWGSHSGPQPWQHANFLNLNQTALNYGNSNFDVRQAFKGYAVYQLPFGKGKMFLNQNSLADAVIGGWQISGTVVESTGNPFNVTTSGPNTYTQDGSQYPNRVAGVSTTPSGGRTLNEWYNPAAFSSPGNGAFGNLRRNSLYGPGINTFNLSGGKAFSLPWEGIKIQIRADMQNAFNHPSFGNPSQVSNGTNLIGAKGTDTGVAGAVFSGPSTGQIHNVTVGGRNVQLGARISF